MILEVFYRDRQRVGRLAEEPRSSRVFFQYDQSWIDGGIELSPFRLPLSVGSRPVRHDDFVNRFTFHGLHGLFADCLPRTWGNTLMVRRFAQLGLGSSNAGVLFRLSCLGDRGMGALSFRPDADAAPQRLIEAASLAEIDLEAVRLKSAPSSVNAKPGTRGIDRARVLLGCLQPGQASSLYSDALNRLADHLHYMSSSGEKAQDATRYWFDTRANLRREMEERKKRFVDKNEVRGRMAEVVKKLTVGATFFDGAHVFTPHSDVPDDGALRLVFMPPEQFFSREEPRIATEGVLDYVRNNGTKPRYRGNRLLFVAPDHGALARLRDCIRVALAWSSIVEDVAAMRLVLDNLQAAQAEKELKTAEEVLPRVARECYKWLLCPAQHTPTGKATVETFALNTGGGALGPEIERVCLDNEWVITTWSPIHLRSKLAELYWKPDKPAVKAIDFWEDSRRYLYLPRLKDRGVLAQAIVKGAATRDFFGSAYAEHDGKFDGFKLGDSNVQLDDTLLLIEPAAAAAYASALALTKGSSDSTGGDGSAAPTPSIPTKSESTPSTGAGTTAIAPKSKTFHGSADVSAATAKMRLVQLAEEIIAVLSADPNAEVKVTVEIAATFASGAQDQTKRAISENAKTLGFKTADWD